MNTIISTIFLLLVVATLRASGAPVSSNAYTVPLKINQPSRRGEERLMGHLNHAFKRYARTSSVAGVTSKSLLPRGTTLTGFDEYGYYGPIQIDSQTVDVIFDSHYGFFFVISTACTSKACTNQTKFNPDDSAHYSVENNNPTNLEYGSNADDHSLTVIIAHDNWSIGNVVSKSEEIYIATSLADGLASLPGGVLGFDPPSKPLMNMYSQNGITPQYSFRFGETSGQLTVGGVDNTQFTGDIKFIPAITSTGSWILSLQDVSVNSVSLNITGRDAIIDTGAALITVPPEDASKIHGAIKNSFQLYPNDNNVFVIPCATSDVVSLVFNGKAFDIGAKNLAFEPIAENPANNPPIPQGSCLSSITGLDLLSNDNEWMIGYTFLRNYYTVFDYSDDHTQIGFGTPK